MRQQMNVMFAIPSYSGNTALECTGAIAQMVGKLYDHGIPHSFRFRGGNCFIDAARNLFIKDFMDAPEFTDLFFLDDDVGYEPHKVVEFLMSGVDIVCGVYPKKSDDAQFPVVMKPNKDGGLIKRGRYCSAVNVPAGFLLLRRHVVEKLIADTLKQHRQRIALVERLSVGLPLEDSTTLRYMASRLSATYKFADVGFGDREVWNVFETGPEDDAFWGEDSLFCKKVIKAGFDIWVDGNINFSHKGVKSWKNNLQASLDAFEAGRAKAA